MSAKRRVAYYYSPDVGHHYYGPGHPMKPMRLKCVRRRSAPAFRCREQGRSAPPGPPCAGGAAARRRRPQPPARPSPALLRRLTHHLILAYGLYRRLEIYKPHAATAEELARFHADDYVDFLCVRGARASRRRGAGAAPLAGCRRAARTSATSHSPLPLFASAPLRVCSCVRACVFAVPSCAGAA